MKTAHGQPSRFAVDPADNLHSQLRPAINKLLKPEGRSHDSQEARTKATPPTIDAPPLTIFGVQGGSGTVNNLKVYNLANPEPVL